MLSTSEGYIDTILHREETEIAIRVTSHSRKDDDWLFSALHAVDGEDLLLQRDCFQVALKLVKLSAIW